MENTKKWVVTLSCQVPDSSLPPLFDTEEDAIEWAKEYIGRSVGISAFVSKISKCVTHAVFVCDIK